MAKAQRHKAERSRVVSSFFSYFVPLVLCAYLNSCPRIVMLFSGAFLPAERDKVAPYAIIALEMYVDIAGKCILNPPALEL